MELENKNRGNKRKDQSAHKTEAGSSLPDGSESEEADKNGEEEQIHKSRSPRSQNIELTVEAPKQEAKEAKAQKESKEAKAKEAKAPKPPKPPKPPPKPPPKAPKPALKPEPLAPRVQCGLLSWSFDLPTSAEEFYAREEIGRPIANSKVVKAKKEGKDGLKIGRTASPQPHANTQTRKKVLCFPWSLLKCLFLQD